MALDWDLIDTPLTSVGSIAWSPALERFAACGDVYMYSDDGLTWVEVTKPTIFANDVNSLIWDTSGFNFICVLNNNLDTDCVVKSPDGINWSIVSAPVTGHWNAVASNGALLVAVGNDGKAMYSSDGGTSWDNTGTDLVSLGATTDWDGIAWNPISQLFVAVARNGSIRIATSPDGESWTGRHGAEVAYQKVWNNIACNPSGIMVATCDANGYDVMRSLDGETWETPYFVPIVPVSVLIVEGTIWSELLGQFMFIQYNTASPGAVVWTSNDGVDGASWVQDAGVIPGAIYDTGSGPGTAYRWGMITEAFEIERFIAGFSLESLTAIITSVTEGGTVLIEFTSESGGMVFSGEAEFEGAFGFIGEGGFVMGSEETQIVIIVDLTGIYTLIRGKRNDTIYARNESTDDTIDVAIPTPFGKIGYLGS